MTSNNNDSTEAEKHKLSLMRASVECRDPSSKEVDDFTLMRFLRARNLDVEKGTALFLKYLKWRREFMPKGYISETQIQDDLAQNKVFFGGIDKKKRPIMVAFAGKHFQNPKPGGLDEFKRFVVYSLEKICSRMPAGQEKFLAIADFQGWGYANCDIRGYLGAFSILQDCFPERLGKLLMVNAPRMFMSAWKIVYPLIDDRTKTKIVFVESSQLRSTLLEEIDESQIPVTYGGSQQLVPIQDA